MVDYRQMSNHISITKSLALALYGNNGAALARALGVSRQSISKIKPGPLPERMAMKLRFVLKPEVFATDSKNEPS